MDDPLFSPPTLATLALRVLTNGLNYHIRGLVERLVDKFTYRKLLPNGQFFTVCNWRLLNEFFPIVFENIQTDNEQVLLCDFLFFAARVTNNICADSFFVNRMLETWCSEQFKQMFFHLQHNRKVTVIRNLRNEENVWIRVCHIASNMCLDFQKDIICQLLTK